MSNREGLRPSFHEITEPLRPATSCSRLTRNRTRTSEVGARRASLTPRVFESGRPVSNGPLRAGDPVLFPMSYVRIDTPGWDRTSVLCRRGTALIPLSYGRSKEPPAGFEPAPRPYKGRVLAVDTTEACEWRRRESNPLLLGASEAFFQKNLIPRTSAVDGAFATALVPARVEDVGSVSGQVPCIGRCGRVESNHHSQRRRGYSALSSPVLSVRRSSAGGIRTHGLELMRLARTAPPLPREVWLAGVEPAISGAQNRRGGLLPYSQQVPGAALAAPGSRRPWNRTTLHRRIRAALAQPARRR